MSLKYTQFYLALWQYLNQPLFPYSGLESIWKPSRFWCIYKIQFLEACWYKPSVIPSHENSGQDEYRTGN